MKRPESRRQPVAKLSILNSDNALKQNDSARISVSNADFLPEVVKE
jgi:hypothetical protein